MSGYFSHQPVFFVLGGGLVYSDSSDDSLSLDLPGDDGDSTDSTGSLSELISAPDDPSLSSSSELRGDPDASFSSSSGNFVTSSECWIHLLVAGNCLL